MIGERPTILVADDDPNLCAHLKDFLGSQDYNVDCVASGAEVLTRVRSERAPDVLVLDPLLPDRGGIELIEEVGRVAPSVPIVVVTAATPIKNIVHAMAGGASDFLLKPVEDGDLALALRRAIAGRDGTERKNLPLHSDFTPFDGVETELLSSDPRVERLREIAARVADADVPVLILGESGVGKEVLARHIHRLSRRRDQPFVKVNCAALPRDLLESELFGSERGAFTGAFTRRPGKFELASDGSILLDEIGEMSPALQAKLLHVIEDGECARLGGTESVAIGARVLASTHRNLEQAIEQGRFRQDLFYRLNVIQLRIPSLRERREDIPLLVNHFLRKYRRKDGDAAREPPGKLLEAFLDYDWPGNVRQLENALKRHLLLPDLPSALEPGASRMVPRDVHSAQESLKDVAARAAERAEKRAVRRALEETSWNRKAAARRLSISYKTLRNKLKKWEVEQQEDRKELGPES